MTTVVHEVSFGKGPANLADPIRQLVVRFSLHLSEFDASRR